MTSPAEIEKRAMALHAWWNKETGQNLPWTVVWKWRWEEWLVRGGFNGPQLRRVLIFLRREVANGKRNFGCLKLMNLLEVEQFQADLGLIDMRKAGKLDPDSKIAMPPDAPPKP